MHRKGAARLLQLQDEHVKGAAIISRILGQAPSGASANVTPEIPEEDDLLLQEDGATGGWYCRWRSDRRTGEGATGAIAKQEEGLREWGFPPQHSRCGNPPRAQAPLQPLPLLPRQQQGEQWREGEVPTAPMPPNFLAILQ